MRTWYKGWAGTTFGHGGFLAPGKAGGKGIDTKTEFHEHVHVEQYEGASLQGFLYGLAVFFVSWCMGGVAIGAMAGGVIWLTGGMLAYACASLQAWFRGESLYMGSVKEEAAYAMADEWEEKQKR